MSDPGSQFYRHIRAYLGAEAAAGFPRLGRVPHTAIIQLLDYYHDQTSLEQGALLERSRPTRQPAFCTTEPGALRSSRAIKPGSASIMRGRRASIGAATATRTSRCCA